MIPKIWEGQECWIIGGGPSIHEQFNVPKKVSNDIQSNKLPLSDLSKYLEPIHNFNIIGVNSAFHIGNWIDILFFGDRSWYDKHKQNIIEFNGLKYTCCSKLRNKKEQRLAGFNHIEKDRGHSSGISPDPNKISWNTNSGGAAIDLAIKVGAIKIFLLGFDMQPNKDNVTHWHGKHYELIRKDGTPKKTPFKAHLKRFLAIAKDAEKLGVEIINCNPKSKITSFKTANVFELLN